MLNKKKFALSFILITTIIPLNLLARDNTPPPKNFNRLVIIAKHIISENSDILNLTDYLDPYYIRINYYSSEKYEIKCQIHLPITKGRYAKYIWIGYSKKDDLYYVDVIPRPQTEKVDFLDNLKTLSQLHIRSQRIRLWERDKLYRRSDR